MESGRGEVKEKRDVNSFEYYISMIGDFNTTLLLENIYVYKSLLSLRIVLICFFFLKKTETIINNNPLNAIDELMLPDFVILYT